MGLVVARSKRDVPAVSGPISVNNLHRIDAVFFAKAFRWLHTSIVPSAANIVDNADKKKLLHSARIPTHCLYHMPSPKKNAHGRCLRFKEHGRVLPMTKPNPIRTASNCGVYIAMLSIS